VDHLLTKEQQNASSCICHIDPAGHLWHLHGPEAGYPLMLPHCEKAKGEYGAICMGVMEMAVFVGKSLTPELRFCPQTPITPKQSAAIVIKYMKDHPDKKDESFRRVTIDAMRGAWPCKE
jgi:hypothetical protein